MIKENETVTAIKGFNTDWTCRGFQYEIGQTYEHDGPVVRCAEGGFHAIEGNPLGVFMFYPPGTSNYATVELSGKIARDESDGKIAAGRITITAELFLPSLVQKGVDWILANISDEKKETNTGDRSAATNMGDESAATNTGHQSAATNTGDESAATNTGHQSAATSTGYQSAATNTGDESAATSTGYQSAATNTGDRSAATSTGYQSAATNTGDRSAATNTGHQSAATNTGDESAATNTGDESAATVEGNSSVAIASGYQGRAKASAGSAIVVCERKINGKLIGIFSGIAGQGGIKPDVWYTAKDGKLIEAEENKNV
jgi:hypothetical protein